MKPSLSHRFSSLDALRSSDAALLIQTARDLKAAERRGALPQVLRGFNVALLSDDHASEAATEFHRAAAGLGAQVSRVPAHPSQSAGDDLDERARLLGRLYQAIECQGMGEAETACVEGAAGVPVFNHWGDAAHPTRVLADLMTMQEQLGKPLNEISLGFAGDPKSPCGHAVLRAVALSGVDLRMLEPEGATVTSGRHPAGLPDSELPDFVCAPRGPGCLPLHLTATRSAANGPLLVERSHNARCLLQAMLVCSVT